MPSLYDLSSQYLFLQNLDDPDYEQSLTDLSTSIEDKLIAISVVIKNLDAEEKAFKEEAARLAAAARTRTSRVEWLKNYAMVALDTIQKEEVKQGVHFIRKQKNGGVQSLVIDRSLLDIQWLIATITLPVIDFPEEIRKLIKIDDMLPDNAHIRADLGDSVEVPGAKLVQGYHIRVK